MILRAWEKACSAVVKQPNFPSDDSFVVVVVVVVLKNR